MRIVPADADGLADAAAAIAAGELVAFPTDTVHGLACRRDDPAALDRLFAAKGRPPDRRVAVLLDRLEAADELGLRVDSRAQAVAAACWPGGVTLILPDNTAGTLGIRVPDHPVTLALLALTGPLPTTSANPHGMPECLATDDLLVAFAGSESISVAVDGDSPGGVGSTVLDLTEERARLLREGAIRREALSSLIGPID